VSFRGIGPDAGQRHQPLPARRVLLVLGAADLDLIARNQVKPIERVTVGDDLPVAVQHEWLRAHLAGKGCADLSDPDVPLDQLPEHLEKDYREPGREAEPSAPQTVAGPVAQVDREVPVAHPPAHHLDGVHDAEDVIAEQALAVPRPVQDEDRQERALGRRIQVDLATGRVAGRAGLRKHPFQQSVAVGSVHTADPKPAGGPTPPAGEMSRESVSGTVETPLFRPPLLLTRFLR
jgi:hypothetical protein